MKVAVVGAGIAGAAVARRLCDAGFDVVVFEKQLNSGGRLASRVLPSGAIADIGAQCFSANSEPFQKFLDELKFLGLAREWIADTWWSGEKYTSAIVENLLNGCRVTTDSEVVKIRRCGLSWVVNCLDGSDHAPFDMVILAIPAPITLRILTASTIRWSEAYELLARSSYDARWVVTLEHSGAALFPEPYFKNRAPGSAISWIGRDRTKPGRQYSREVLVIHMSAPWSNAQRSISTQSAIDAAVEFIRKSDLFRHDGFATGTSGTAVFWEYARTVNTVGLPFLWSPLQSLGVAGDSFMGSSVEASYLSGECLSSAILKAKLKVSKGPSK